MRGTRYPSCWDFKIDWNWYLSYIFPCTCFSLFEPSDWNMTEVKVKEQQRGCFFLSISYCNRIWCFDCSRKHMTDQLCTVNIHHNCYCFALLYLMFLARKRTSPCCPVRFEFQVSFQVQWVHSLMQIPQSHFSVVNVITSMFLFDLCICNKLKLTGKEIIHTHMGWK